MADAIFSYFESRKDGADKVSTLFLLAPALLEEDHRWQWQYRRLQAEREQLVSELGIAMNLSKGEMAGHVLYCLHGIQVRLASAFLRTMLLKARMMTSLAQPRVNVPDHVPGLPDCSLVLLFVAGSVISSN